MKKRLFSYVCLALIVLSCSEDEKTAIKSNCKFTFKGTQYQAAPESIVCTIGPGINAVTGSSTTPSSWQLTVSEQGVIMFVLNLESYHTEVASVSFENSVFTFEETIESIDDSGIIKGSCTCGL